MNRRLVVGGAILGAIVVAGALAATLLEQPGYALGAAAVGVVVLFVLIGQAKGKQGQ